MSKKNGNLKEMNIDDLGINWEKYPVEDDLKITEEINTSSDDGAPIDEVAAYIDDLAHRINSGDKEVMLPQSVLKKRKGDREFVKELNVAPQEVQQEEEIVITFTPPAKNSDYLCALIRVETIAGLLIYMDYISRYYLGNFHKGEIRLTFDPIYQTHGAIKMATDCIMNGINDPESIMIP